MKNIYLLFSIIVCVNAYQINHVKFSGNGGVFGFIECGIHRFDARYIIFQLECNACGTGHVYKCNSSYKCKKQSIQEACNGLINNYNYLDSRIVCISKENMISCIEFKDIDESKSSIKIKTSLVTSSHSKKSEHKIEYMTDIKWEQLNDAYISQRIEKLRKYLLFSMELKNVMYIYEELTGEVYSQFIEIIKLIKLNTRITYSSTFAYKKDVPVSMFVRNFLNLYYSQKTINSHTLDTKIMLLSTLASLYRIEDNVVNEYGSMKLSLDRSKCTILNNSSPLADSEYCLYLDHMLALESKASKLSTYSKCGTQFVDLIFRHCKEHKPLLLRVMSVFGNDELCIDKKYFPCILPKTEESIDIWMLDFDTLVHSVNLQYENITFAIKKFQQIIASEDYAIYIECAEQKKHEIFYSIFNQLLFDSLGISDTENVGMIVEIYNQYTTKFNPHPQFNLNILKKIFKFLELKSTSILNTRRKLIIDLLSKVLNTHTASFSSYCDSILNKLKEMLHDQNIKCPIAKG